MKTRKIKIKPFKGIQRVGRGTDGQGTDTTHLLKIIQEMGYIIYEDPTNDDCVIISDRLLTYGDLKKNPKKFSVDIFFWENDTDCNDRLDEELDEVCI